MPNENGVNEDISSSVATDQETENEVIDTPVVEAESAKADEGNEPAQEGAADSTGDPKPEADNSPKHFREGYDALAKDVKEKYKPVMDEVDLLGGVEVLRALKPLADLALNADASAADVVRTLKEVMLPQHMEAVAWSALDNPATQEVIMNDPDVQQAISDRFFQGRSLEEVQSMMEVLGAEEESDPEKAEMKKQLASINESQRTEAARKQQEEANRRTDDLQKRFYVDTAEEVLKRFNMVAPEGASAEDKQLFENTVEDIRYAAQGRFLNEHSGEYMQIHDMYAKGLVTQARVAEARLHNTWQATLIRTAERHSKQLQAMSASRKSEQQAKVANTRPDVSGNAPNEAKPNQTQYDLSDPNWLDGFLADFKREAALRAQ